MSHDPKRHAFDVMVATSTSLLTLSSLLLTALAAAAAGLVGPDGPQGVTLLSFLSGGVYLFVCAICCFVLFRSIELANANNPDIDDKAIRKSLFTIIWLFPIGVILSVAYFITVPT